MQTNITSIIFDLGRVIVDVSDLALVTALQRAGVTINLEQFKTFYQHPEFLNFEAGRVLAADFFPALQNILAAPQVPCQDLKAAWNAMIANIPEKNITLLKALRKNHKLFALSNTNSSHVEAINAILQKNYACKDFRAIFDEVYYSFEIGICKPNPALFKKIINEQQLTTAQTLFIDDALENIVVAKELGLQTIHFTHGKDLSAELQRCGILATQEETYGSS